MQHRLENVLEKQQFEYWYKKRNNKEYKAKVTTVRRRTNCANKYASVRFENVLERKQAGEDW